jgi:hypothetical protein
LNFLAQGFEGGRDRGELFTVETVEADRLRLLEAVAGEIADDAVLRCDDTRKLLTADRLEL